MREVLLVGGGHAHTLALLAFAADPLPRACVTLLSDTPKAVYSGMVPGVVAGMYRPEDAEIDLSALAEAAGAHLVLDTAVRVDPFARRIHLARGNTLTYDLASLNVGSTVAGLQLPGVARRALPTRPIGPFVREVLAAVGRARVRTGRLRVAVVGGGAGGTEIAFALRHRLTSEGVQADVTLVESGPHILEAYPAGLRRRAHDAAGRRQIAIRTRAVVREVGDEGVILEDGEVLPADLVIWVTGARGHPFMAESGLATDARGFALVRSTLQLRDHEDLFASGDCGTLMEHPATPKAGVYAVRQVGTLAHNLKSAVGHGSFRHYRPQRDFLALLNLGDGSALGSKMGVSLSGRWVMALKDRIDRSFIRRLRHMG